MNKAKLISEFTEKIMEIYVDRDTYSRGKIIDLAKQIFADVINKNCNLQNVSQQRELLLAYERYVAKCTNYEMQEGDYLMIETFLKANNCG